MGWPIKFCNARVARSWYRVNRHIYKFDAAVASVDTGRRPPTLSNLKTSAGKEQYQTRVSGNYASGHRRPQLEAGTLSKSVRNQVHVPDQAHDTDADFVVASRLAHSMPQNSLDCNGILAAHRLRPSRLESLHLPHQKADCSGRAWLGIATLQVPRI